MGYQGPTSMSGGLVHSHLSGEPMTTAAQTCLGSCWPAAWQAPPCCYSPVNQKLRMNWWLWKSGFDSTCPFYVLLLLDKFLFQLQSLPKIVT